MSDLKNSLKSLGIEKLTIIDVGAKDYLEYIDDLKVITQLHAFEPNPDEYAKLEVLYKNNSFAKLALNKIGLSENNGVADFFVTNHNSMSSLLEADLTNYKKHFGAYKEYRAWENNISANKTISIDLQTLDSYFEKETSIVDYLKIDTQGSELAILKGAKNLLKEQRISVIKVEVSTVAVYKDQAFFSDIDQYLRSYNYTLVDFLTYRDDYKPLFKSQKQNAHYAPCGDAIYVLSEKSKDRLTEIKKGLILSWLGYRSIAQDILSQLILKESEMKFILSIKQQAEKPFRKILAKNITPPLLYRLIKKIIWRLKNPK